MMIRKPTYKELEQKVKELEGKAVERNRAGEALERLSETWKLAQEMAKIGNWHYNIETQQPIWSEQMFKVLGCDPEKGVPGYEAHKEIFYPDDWEMFDEAVQGATNGIPYNIEARVTFSDGSIHWCNAQGFPRFNRNGDVVALFGTTQDITDRKNAEEALRESEARYRKVSENSPAVLYQFMMTPDGTFSFPFVSDSVKTIMGISAEELMNDSSTLFEIVHPEDREMFQEGIMKSAESLESFPVTFRCMKDGEVVWTEARGMPEPLADGDIIWDGFLLDITDRKRAEEALAESERQYKALYGTMRLMCDNAPDMIWAKDLEGRFLFANEATCRNRLMAKDRDEPIGKTESYFIHREQQKRLGDPQWHTLGESHKDSAEIVLKSKQPGKFQETGYVKGKFVHLDVRKAPFLDEDGCIIGTVGCGRDITKEKALEAEHDTLLARVKETAESYRDLVENINDVIYSTDENGIVSYISPRVKTFMGYDPSEILGKSFTEFVHPDDLPFLLGRFQEIKKGILRPAEYRLRAKSGKYHWVRSSTRPILNGDHFAGLKGLFIDITEERQLKENLLQARKMEAISTLTGGIAHDYNNLMAVILGNLSLATEQVELGTDLADFLTEANTASYKVRDLTHELMALSRGGEPVKEVGSLKELLKSALDTITRHGAVSPKESIPQDLWQVPCDPYKMGAVFRNVLTNAVEAMPDGGILTIKAENLRIGDENRYPDLPLNPCDYVHIAIEDQGKGIPEEHLEKIFDPYFSTKARGVQKGMGLGLTTSYAIVKKHGGHLALDSTPHVGTTVNIYLPATAAESIAPDAQRDRAEVQSSIANQQSSIQRVLVMDDEEMLRNLAEQMLKRLGYAVETVKDGLQAIETYKNRMDLGKPFDAVILDLTIKGGMGGEQTIAELLKIDPDVKAIVCSGYFDDPVLANHAEYGFQAAMAKPYQKNDLKRVLKKIL